MINECICIPHFIVVPCHFSELHNKTIIASFGKGPCAQLFVFYQDGDNIATKTSSYLILDLYQIIAKVVCK